MVKDGEDWHRLQTMKLKSLAKLFKPWRSPFDIVTEKWLIKSNADCMASCKLFKNKLIFQRNISDSVWSYSFQVRSTSCFDNFFNRFLELVQPTDGEEYSKTSFLGARIERFSFIIITQQWHPPEHLMEQTYPIRVIIPSRPDSHW